MRLRRLGALALILTIAGTTAACTTPPAHTPVIFVHGWGGSAADWTTQMAQFQAAGYTSSEMTAITYDTAVSVVDSSVTLARAVDDVLARTGAPKVDIVSYSQGSLVTKQCIIATNPDGRPDCHGKVDHWMSIAGVDNGTEFEIPLAVGQPSNEDVQGRTPVIKNLQDHWCVLVKQGVQVEVQWISTDGIVRPPDRSKEPAFAVNIELDKNLALNHLTIYKYPGVISETIAFLAR